ncbi:MAG: histidine phosphatase family protein [Methyloligellaceae bacterium]
MTLIYLVRHGQTDWNAASRLQGQIDTPINERGQAQARRNGETLKALIGDPAHFDFVASPLTRTRQTMEIIRSVMGLPAGEYRTDPLLKEIHFGEWQGRTWEELRRERPQEMAARFADPWNTVAPGEGGESYAMLAARALKWLESVTRDTIAVTHGGINRCLRCHLEDLPRNEVAHLKVPQDKVLVIDNGKTGWV